MTDYSDILQEQMSNASISGSALSSVAADTAPQLGGNLDTNEKSILWNVLISSDESWSGDTIMMNVDANDYGFGATMYIASDGNLETCGAEVSPYNLCFALVMSSGTGSKTVLLRGLVRDDSWDWVPGRLLYVSNIIGGMTQTTLSGSSQNVQILGRALTTDIIYFNPDFTYIEIA